MEILQYGALGLVSLVLMAIGTFVGKAVWPFFKGQIERHQRVLEDNAKHCENRLTDLAREFAGSMRAQAEASQRMANEFANAMKKLESRRDRER